MRNKPSAIDAHDHLLAEMPPGAVHDRGSCPVCATRQTASITSNTQEINVSGTDQRTFTLAEHEAILSDAVQREVAAATSDKEARIQELEGKIDTLEAEKASLVEAKEAAESKFEQFEQETERKREIAERRDARVDAVRSISIAELDDEYFTEQRVNRWAEMADEDFTALLEDLAAPSLLALTTEEASALDGLEGQERLSKLGAVIAKRREVAGDGTDATARTKRETAAFTGGATPTGTKPEGTGLRQFLGAVQG